MTIPPVHVTKHGIQEHRSITELRIREHRQGADNEEVSLRSIDNRAKEQREEGLTKGKFTERSVAVRRSETTTKKPEPLNGGMRGCGVRHPRRGIGYYLKLFSLTRETQPT